MAKKKKKEKNHYIVKNKISIFYQVRDFLLTLMLWALWAYIFYPLIALLLWRYLDIDIFYDKSQDEIRALGNSLYTFVLSSGAIILLLILSFNGWGFYNKKRFQYKGNKRRGKPTPISSEVMAKSLEIDPKSIELSKEARYVQIYHTHESPTAQEGIFKPTDDLDVKSVNLFFSDNWDKVRESSNFGYTHMEQKEDKELNDNQFQIKK